MTLPTNFTLVRHGLSEANRVQKFMKKNDSEGLRQILDVEEMLGRHDSTSRLSLTGVQQAQTTGEWLREQSDRPAFERFYVSPHIRTRETAAHLGLNGDWLVDDLFRERDWGEISNPNDDLTSALTPQIKRFKNLNEWYWKPLGGESLATGVRARVEFVMESLHRRGHLDNVIAVTHGEFIRVAQFVIEKMTPDQFNEMDADPAFKVENTMVIEYTRQNPSDPQDRRDHYTWRRATCPWDESRSWCDGQWVQFGTRTFSDSDLLTFAEKHPRFFMDERL